MKTYVVLGLVWFCAYVSYGQTYDELMSQAADAIGRKDYCIALGYLEKGFVDTSHVGAYDLAFGAVAAANCQKPSIAMTWLRRSMAKGLGQRPGETEQVINDGMFAVLHTYPDWPIWVKEMRDAQHQRDTQTQKQQLEWMKITSQNAVASPSRAGKYLNAPTGFAQYLSRSNTIEVPYLVKVPQHYAPTKSYPLIVYLHGGIVSTETFQNQSPDVSNEPIFKSTSNALVLYPFGKKTFGWVSQKEAFRQVLEMIDEVVKRYNVDPKHIYLGGMSNGATATFWYAAHMPTRFAGFYAFAPGPSLEIDPQAFDLLRAGTTIISVSAKDDSVYAYDQVRAAYDSHRQQVTSWTFKTLESGGHGFIYSPDGLVVMQQTLSELLNK